MQILVRKNLHTTFSMQPTVRFSDAHSISKEEVNIVKFHVWKVSGLYKVLLSAVPHRLMFFFFSRRGKNHFQVRDADGVLG